MSRERTGLEIAVVGMACRLPGADGPAAFWRNLRQGVESIRRFSDEELIAAGVSRRLLASPAYVKARAIVEDVERFDARLFGYSPREAELIDPQHRLLLECAWHALEDAAHDPEQGRSSVGVFAGCATSDYLLNIYSQWARGPRDGLQTLMGTEKDYLASRISYKLGLDGPSIAVQTACSSSLVAVHLACQSLLGGECDLALAGGVTLQVPQVAGYLWQDGGIYSPTGRCRPFDAAADGTVFGEGAGLVVLKRLEDALSAGDRVRAVILGSAINNDGAAKVGYTAPGVKGQAAAIRAALEMAEVDPAEIGYVEAHGTATRLGDPIEVAALREAFRGSRRREPCGLGSVKGNFGHLANAAGVAGLLKTVLALEHGELPPSVHFATPNPDVDFALDFRVVTELEPWPSPAPRRAGVSSFGLGGTNAHLVLEEAPPVARGPASSRRALHVLPFSAGSQGSLERLQRALAESLRDDPGRELGDVAYTLSVGRRRLAHRRVVVASTAAEAAAALAGSGGRRPGGRQEADRSRPVVLLLPGHGSEHPGMGAGLYAAEAVFRDEVDRCCELLRRELGEDLRGILSLDQDGRETAEERLGDTRWIQPALFTVEYALARLWQSWGIEPEAMIGHSVGELVAAALAEVFPLPDALRLVAVRGRLMAASAAGGMLVVPLPEREVERRLEGSLVVASVNAPASTVVSGPAAEVAALHDRLQEEGIGSRPLPTGHAYHSPAMAEAAARFTEEVARTAPSPPRVPFLSNVTGTWITAAEAVDPDYWGRQMLAKVRFSAGIEELLRDPRRLFLEVGPSRVLASLVRRHRRAGGAVPDAIPSLPHPRQGRPEPEAVLEALGALWAGGADVDWRSFHLGRETRPVELPLYPFDRQRYWIDRLDLAELAGLAGAPVEDPARWFAVPVWTPAAAPAPAALPAAARCVIFDEGRGLGEALGRHLADDGLRVTRVVRAKRFELRGDGVVALDPGDADAWDRLLSSIGGPPQALFHLWSLAPPADAAADAGDADRVERALREGALLFLGLARALGQGGDDGCRALLVTAGAQPLRPGEPCEPLGALLAGPATVLPQEGMLAAARLLDLDPQEVGRLLSPRQDAAAAPALRRLARRLCRELPAVDSPGAAAWRGSRRFERRLERLRLDGGTAPLRDGGAYLVTGGLGGLGLALAGHLARTRGARLALLSRRRLPPREGWEERCRRAPETAESRLLAKLLEIEASGGEVLPLCADVTDGPALEAALGAAEERFGPLTGVFHLAGTVDPKLGALKTPAEAAAVLAPKLVGTLNLRRALTGRSPELVVLYSSVIALTGELGQLDYCAANGFLDAYAHRWQEELADTRVVAVDWSVWRELGMATAEAEAPVAHPLLQRRLVSTAEGSLFEGRFDPAELWVLGEHRAGATTAVLPGTAYLEMARAAWVEAGGGLPVAMLDVTFGAPLTARDGEPPEVQLLLSAGGQTGRRRFVVRSRRGQGSGWIQHAAGSLEPAAGGEETPRTVPPRGEESDVAGLLAGASSGGVVRWGERWQARGRLWLDGDEIWAELSLPERFVADLQTFALHPALLDVATAASLALASGGSYLPLSYRRVVVHGALSPEVRVHGRRRDGGGGGGVLVADLRIAGPDGEPLVTVEDYTLRRVERLAAAGAAAGGAAPPKAALPPELAAVERRRQAMRAAAGAPHHHGFTPGEALEALERVLVEPVGPQVAVTKLDLDEVWRAISQRRPRGDSGEATEGEVARHDRPDLQVDFVAPRNELESACAAIWERLLGVRPVGVDDDFFALGGHSLIALQLVGELRSAFDVDLGIGVVFDHPTVSAQVELITRQMASGVAAEEMDAALAALAGLSDDEVAALIAGEGTAGEQGGAA